MKRAGETDYNAAVPKSEVGSSIVPRTVPQGSVGGAIEATPGILPHKECATLALQPRGYTLHIPNDQGERIEQIAC